MTISFASTVLQGDMIDIYNVVSARVNQRVVERVSKYKQVIQFKRVADMLLKPIIPEVPQIIITCNGRT